MNLEQHGATMVLEPHSSFAPGQFPTVSSGEIGNLADLLDVQGCLGEHQITVGSRIVLGGNVKSMSPLTRNPLMSWGHGWESYNSMYSRFRPSERAGGRYRISLITTAVRRLDGPILSWSARPG